MSGPVATVDIGSNSVRLVVYSGATRVPSVLFNEKVMAGLGRGLAEAGALSREASIRALAALGRFKLLVERMGVVRTRAFATAAVREAANGEEFLRQVRGLGLDPQILSGQEEGRLAGLGVLSGIPEADGVAGDLGGGSLELADLGSGRVGRCVTLPLGVLRLAAMEAETGDALLRRLRQELQASGFAGAASGRSFYMVGGSWRALAKLDLDLLGHPLPMMHQHVIPPDRATALGEAIAAADRQDLKGITSGARVPTLPHAALLLRAVVDALRPERLVVSAYGVREGLLFDDLEPAQQRRDPLIEAAREVGAGLGRFPEHGQLIDQWIAPVFDDCPDAARLRLAACLLSDVGWAAHPDFRAERGVDMALHNNWVGIDAPGRVLLAQALFAVFGGGGDLPDARLASLADGDALRRARAWGLTIRLAQRLSAGVAEPISRSCLSVEGGRLVLWLPEQEAPMFGESVERRLKSVAQALGKEPDFLFG